MTNRHVVRPDVGEDIVKSFLRSYKKAMKGVYQEKMSQLEPSITATLMMLKPSCR